MLTLDLTNTLDSQHNTLSRKQSIPEQVDRPINDINF